MMRFIYQQVEDKPTPRLPTPYNLSLPFDGNWGKARNKALFVIEHVSRGDLKNRALLSDEVTLTTYKNVINYALAQAKKHGADQKWAMSFYNFNRFKTYHLDPPLARTSENIFARAVKRHVRKIKPTLIVILGDNAARLITGNQNIAKYRGWVHDYKGIPLVNTIDIDRAFNPPGDGDDLSDDAELYANALGYAARTIANGFIGKLPHSVGEVKAKPILVDTLTKFKRMMRKVRSAPKVSIDTETTSLHTLEAQMLTVQFAISSDAGYVLPIYHKDAPWSSSEMDFIQETLKQYFETKHDWYNGPDTKFHIGVNYGYDMRVLMQWLSVRYFYWPVWDVQGAEMVFDENVKVLSQYGTPFYNLAQLSTSYGNDAYYTAEFGKEDRVTIAEQDLSGAVLDYCALDVQLPYAIQCEQMRRARLMGSYLKTYHRFVLTQIASMTRMTSAMMYRGTKVDSEYLINLLKPRSKLTGVIDDIRTEFYADPDVEKANAMLCEGRGIPMGSLFGSGDGRVFDMTKKAHMSILYQDVLELEPLRYSRKTDEPSFDKEFLNAYKENYKPVELVARVSSLEKIKSSFVDSFFVKMTENPDSKIDSRIRPNFGYLMIVTGRLNSSNPSLQQIPEHSGDANIVKAMFITAPFTLHFEADYSAHEVRVWGIMSGDNVLLTTFRNIHKLIVRYRRRPTPRNYDKMKTEGDPHKQNYSLFTGVALKLIDKVMRQAAKGIVFGSMYGMSVNSLAAQIDKSIEETEEIRNKFFSKFNKAGKWLQSTVENAKKYFFTESLIGRRRNLFGMMSGHRGVQGSMSRRAMNSPIQGMASDFGIIASDIFARAIHECYTELGIEHDTSRMGDIMDLRFKTTNLPSGPNAMVHDSVKGEAHFDVYLLNLRVLEWAMTHGLIEYLDRVHNVRVTVPFDIECDIGSGWGTKETWDWSDKQRDEFIIKAINDHKELFGSKDKRIADLDAESMLAHMLKTYEKQCKQLDIDRRFPRNL